MRGPHFLTRSPSQIEAHEAGLQLRTIVLEFDRYETAVAARKRKPITKRCRRSAPAPSATFALLKGRSRQT